MTYTITNYTYKQAKKLGVAKLEDKELEHLVEEVEQ